MKIQFNYINDDKKLQQQIKEFAENLFEIKNGTAPVIIFQKSDEDLVTIISDIDLREDSLTVSDIGNEDEQAREEATSVGFEILDNFSHLKKLRLFHGQEHALLTRKEVKKIQSGNEEDVLTGVWGKKTEPTLVPKAA